MAGIFTTTLIDAINRHIDPHTSRAKHISLSNIWSFEDQKVKTDYSTSIVLRNVQAGKEELELSFHGQYNKADNPSRPRSVTTIPFEYQTMSIHIESAPQVRRFDNSTNPLVEIGFEIIPTMPSAGAISPLWCPSYLMIHQAAHLYGRPFGPNCPGMTVDSQRNVTKKCFIGLRGNKRVSLRDITQDGFLPLYLNDSLHAVEALRHIFDYMVKHPKK